MKKAAFFLLAFLLLFSACGNGGADATPETSESPADATSVINPATPTPAATAAPTPTQTPTPKPSPTPTGYVDPLTGLETETDISNNRPYAVMLNNIYESLPQCGQSKADIIYEVLVEGGITRMLAVYQDIGDVGEIGSVRSTRPYFLDIVAGMDAILLHCGASEDAYSEMDSRNITDLDGIYFSAIYYRSAERLASGYRTEYTLFTNGEMITQTLPLYSVALRMLHADGYACNMRFGTNSAASGEDADYLSVEYSAYKDSTFSYDEDAGAYLVSQFDEAYIDGDSGEQVSVKNVLVLETKCIYSGDSYLHVDIELVGSGSGLYLCEGKYVPIAWSREDADSQFVYTLTDGSELVFAPGTTYINIITEGNCVIID